MKGVLSAAILLSLFSSSSYALTSQEFYDKCNNLYQSPGKETPQDAVNRALNAGSCSGFVGGMINGFNLVGNMLGQKGAVKRNFVCLPAGKQSQELLDEVIAYIKENPEKASEPVQISVYNTFVLGYPCEEFANKPATQP